MIKTEVLVRRSLPRSLPGSPLIIIDRKLVRLPFVKEWLSKYKYISVEAGESLKTIERFQWVAKNVLAHSSSTSLKSICLVAVGGGSVGDFVGFLASVLKRGVNLIHIPSTWLSAIDSSHGGKTALNLAGVKNQIGTFYPATQVYLIRELLLSQPEFLADQGVSELLKIGLIDGGKLWKSIYSDKTKMTSAFIYKNLEPAVQAKYKIVRKDPFEKTGVRHILNLGHTVGHFYEAHYGLSHGDAVGFGLNFSLHWSLHKKFLSSASFDKVVAVLSRFNFDQFDFKPAREKQFLSYLSQDKKMVGRSKVRFVFVKGLGRVFVEAVSLKSVAQFALKIGVIR